MRFIQILFLLFCAHTSYAFATAKTNTTRRGKKNQKISDRHSEFASTKNTEFTPQEAEVNRDERERIEQSLKFFATKLNKFVTDTKFHTHEFEPNITNLQYEILDIERNVANMSRSKSYPELLLRMFRLQFRTMVDATNMLAKFNTTGLLGDELRFKVLEFRVIALSLDSTFFVSLTDTAEYETRVSKMNCRFIAAVDKYRSLPEASIHNQKSFWKSVERTKKTIDILKRLVGDTSTWGVC